MHLYEDYGARCVDHLRGMFAFAIWDTRRRTLLLARDRLGIKPLYYAERERRAAVRLGAQAAASGTTPPIDRSAGKPSDTCSRSWRPRRPEHRPGHSKLEPARVAVATANRPPRSNATGTWRSNPTRASARMRSWSVCEALLHDAVSSHQVSDVPVGAFLSGGIDSSAVVALMAKPRPARLKTFSIGFAEAGFDELAHARVLSRRGSAPITTTSFFRPDVVQTVEDLTWYLDEPFGDTSAIPTYMVSKLAAEHVKVVLSGDGGDELFAGYDSTWSKDANAPSTGVPRPLGVPARSARCMPHGMYGRRFLRHLALDGARRYLDASSLFHDR